MINRFKAKFGAPDDVVVAFGDWEQKHHMKLKEPTKGKGFSKLFRKHGYAVLLVDNSHQLHVLCIVEMKTRGARNL